MSSAKITLLGFYSYMNSHGKDLFELLNVPTGIDKQILIDNILSRGGEFEVLYSNPEFTHDIIGSWSSKWNRTFTKWVEALSIEFAPLENYDRIETITDTEHIDGSNNSNGNAHSYTNNSVSAFNSDFMQNESGTNSSMDNSNESSTKTDSTKTHTARIRGNIGVTTSTAMLEDFLRVEQWNIYEHITDIFLSEFVIPIY